MAEQQNSALAVYVPPEDRRGQVFGDPGAFDQAMREVAILQKAGMIPRAYKNNVGDVLIAISVAQQVRMHPLMVMQNLVVIHGQPSWKATFLGALAQTRGYSLDYEVERRGGPLKYRRLIKGRDNQPDRHVDAEIDDLTVTCILERGGRKYRGVAVTSRQAIAAGWAHNEQYTHSGELMLRYRALAFAVRQFEPGAMLGLLSDDEALVVEPEPQIPGPGPTARAVPKTIDAIVEQVNQAAPSPSGSGAAAGGGGDPATAATAAPSSAPSSSDTGDGAASDPDAAERAALIAEIKELAPQVPEAERDRIKADHGLQRIPKNAKIEKLRLLVVDLRTAVRRAAEAEAKAAAALDAFVDATDPSQFATDEPPPVLTAEQRVGVEQSCRALEKSLGPEAWQGVRRHQEIGLAEALTTMSHSRIIAYHSALQAIEAGEGGYFEDEGGEE